MSTENRTPGPTNVSELAREAAKAYLSEDRQHRDVEEHILSALSKLAAEKDAEIARHVTALKVARDALEESGCTIATMRKLAPENARPSVLMPDGQEVTHREMCTITQDQITDALQHIDKELL